MTATAKNDPSPLLGDTMPDGTIYAGTSPDTGRAMYATPAEAFIKKDDLAKYVTAEAHGHSDWRVPSLKELNMLFNRRAAIGGFERRDNWFRSAATGEYRRLATTGVNGPSALRLVRG